MIDPLPTAVPSDVESDTPPPDGGGAVPVADEAGGAVFVPGQRWRHYTVGPPIEGGPAGAYQGVEAGSMEPVVLVNRPLAAVTAARVQAWERLHDLQSDRLVMCIEAVEEKGRRIEVYGAPALPTLPEWVVGKTIPEEIWKSFAQQLAVILRALHAEGVAHLGLRPDTVHVEKRDGEYHVVLGGLHAATLIDQPDLVRVEVNPCYAPPEAAGLYQIPAGRGLCAWDWWSLGRLVQEGLLGRPMLAQVLDCPGRVPGPEYRERAERLLLERDPGGHRAGAVELMPAGLSPQMTSLLRGLLASSRDGRWQGDDVMHCLNGEQVEDHYDLPREARLFFWRDKAYTLSRLAEHFGENNLWAEGEAVLFAPPEDPAGLQGFLAEVPAYRKEQELLAGLLEMFTMPAWAAVPEEARRSALATLAWLAFGAQPGREHVALIRGRRLEVGGMRQLLNDELSADAVALIHALTADPFRSRLASLGGGASLPVLTQLAATGDTAISRAIQEGWADASDTGLQAKIYTLSLETEKELLDRLALLKHRYAGNRNPVITALMNAPKPEPWALVLLGFMAGFPNDYGFITHAEWNQQRYRVLRERAGQLVAGLFWRRLRRLMLVNPALLGTWPMFSLVWGVPLLLAAAAQAWGAGLLILLLAAGVRYAAYPLLNESLSRVVPSAARWSWRDRPGRCRTEAAACLGAEASVGMKSLSAELAALTAEAATLALPVPAAALPAASRLRVLWTASSLALALAALLAYWQARPLWVRSDLDDELQRPVSVLLVVPAGKRAPGSPATTTVSGQIFEEANDGFGRHQRGPLKAWDVPPPPKDKPPVPLAVQEEGEVNPDQVAYALVSGNLLLEPYPRKGLNIVLAIRVPADHMVGLVLLDTKQRRLVDPRLYLLGESPQPRTWYRIGEQRVVYLGEPESMKVENTLAQP